MGRLGYFYKYRRSESCLPRLADYIKVNGNIIPSENCAFLHMSALKEKVQEILLAVDDISLPTAYYMDEIDDTVVQAKIDEYYENGDFLQPIIVKRTKAGYLLKDSFAQFKAAQELNLSECLFKVI